MDNIMAIITINADQPQNTINRNLYGQFAEHLGRCIYEGLYAVSYTHLRAYRGDDRLPVCQGRD